MHCRCKLGAYSYYYVAEDKLSALAAYRYADDLLVLEAVFFSGLGIEVDMPLCNDNALSKLYLTLGTYQLAGGCACYVAGLLNGRDYAELSCIGKGYLYLTVGSYGTEDRAGKLTLGTYYSDLLKAEELTGLRKILFVCELCALAEKSLKSLLCNVYVTG